jgi:hypothetical protein
MRRNAAGECFGWERLAIRAETQPQILENLQRIDIAFKRPIFETEQPGAGPYGVEEFPRTDGTRNVLGGCYKT